MNPGDVSEVFLIGFADSFAAVKSLLGRAELGTLSGKRVAVKANFNSADPFPASTHLDTLEALVSMLKQAEPAAIALGERSGMGDTRENLEKLGVFDLGERLGLKVVVLDEEPEEAWVKIEHGETHWLRGFYMSKLFLESDVVIQTCCLKTHRFGGHFTMSLKNSVGLVAAKVPGGMYNYMWELHGSPFQRRMIAEINKFYEVDLVVMDAAKAFISDGPEKGTEVEPGLMLASRDRVALDAVGVAILKQFGAASLDKKPVFEQDQIRRAVELGLGAPSAAAIRLTPLDDQGVAAIPAIERILNY